MAGVTARVITLVRVESATMSDGERRRGVVYDCARTHAHTHERTRARTRTHARSDG